MKRMISFWTRLCEDYLPDAFVFCLLLTLIVYCAALFFTPSGAGELTVFWAREFWSLHSFSMQMVFVLITGHMLATTELIGKLLLFIAQRMKNESQALVVLSVFSVAASWINWGFGLIVSGILAIEMARTLKKTNFGLFVASAYAGFVVWHAGLSGSIPLKIAGADEVLQKVFPELSVPLAETIFSSTTLLAVVLILFSFPVLSLFMRTEEKQEVPPAAETSKIASSAVNFREKIEHAWFLNIIFFLAMVSALFLVPGNLDINRVNFIFLAFAVLLHKTPARVLRALNQAVPLSAGIIIQFPFYAGLMGLMQYSGLADQISAVFVEISSRETLPLFTFLSAGIVNFFIPSGGGQWVVQGPLMLKAARDLGADPGKIAMALAWGDAWTNLIQPFWALPLLALARLQLKDIMGYCLIYVAVSGVIIGSVLFFA